MLKWVVPVVALCAAAVPAWAADADSAAVTQLCGIPQTQVAALQNKLHSVVQSGNGGLFKPNEMWSAVVDRHGVLCSVVLSSPDAWPGSRAIAIAKAETANGFSNDKLALSTANLYSGNCSTWGESGLSV
jgi:hypothetical protein